MNEKNIYINVMETFSNVQNASINARKTLKSDVGVIKFYRRVLIQGVE